MRNSRFLSGRIWPGAALALVLAACAEQSTAPRIQAPGEPSFWPEGAPPARTTVCKVGPAGDYTFEIVYEGVGTLLVSNPFTLAAGECKEVYEGGARVEGFRVTEIGLPAGVTVESIEVVDLEDPDCPDYCGLFTGTNTRNAQVWEDRGFVFTFTNQGPPAPSLRIDKVADTSTEEAGNPIGFQITVYSDGPGTATGVTVADALPTGSGIVWTENSADCEITGNLLSCSFGDMAAGTSRTVHVTSPTTAQSCGVYDNTATVTATNHGPVSDDATVTVTCAPPPTGTQGCTPGYWKQQHHFDSWVGHLPTDSYNGTFGVSLFGGSTTLLDALKKGGGGKYRLGRHSTAALLNASNPDVDYGMTAAQVIALVQAVVASGDYDFASDQFEAFNEKGCPLN